MQPVVLKSRGKNQQTPNVFCFGCFGIEPDLSGKVKAFYYHLQLNPYTFTMRLGTLESSFEESPQESAEVKGHPLVHWLAGTFEWLRFNLILTFTYTIIRLLSNYHLNYTLDSRARVSLLVWGPQSFCNDLFYIISGQHATAGVSWRSGRKYSEARPLRKIVQP